MPIAAAKKIKLSIIIPAYNEGRTIIQILELVKEQKVEHVEFERIVIDDGSKDETVQRLRERPDLYDRLIVMPKNGGKGAAVKAGLQMATGDYVLFQDADLEYSPSEYPKLLMPVLSFDADVVIGSRFLAPSYTRVHYFWNSMGNKTITFLFNILYNKTFTDIYSCYLLFRRNSLVPNELRTCGFQQQAEILTKIVRRCNSHYEVPIGYNGRTYEEGKKIRARHALQVIWTLFKERFVTIRPIVTEPANHTHSKTQITEYPQG